MADWKDVVIVVIAVGGLILVAYIIARPKSVFFVRDEVGNIKEIHKQWSE